MDQKQIEKLKEQHPDCKVVEFEDGKIAVFAKPTRSVVGLLMLNMRTRGPLSAADTLIDNCWLGGDDEVKTDVGYAVGLVGLLDDLTMSKKADIKN